MPIKKAISKTAGIAIVVVLLIVVIAAAYMATQTPPTTPSPTTPATTPSSTTPAPAKPKVALILPGTIQDTGWNTMAYLGLSELARKYGVETAYSERVSVADADRVAREYITAGYNFIIFHGGEYLDLVKKIAPEYPDVSFSIVTSDVVPDMPPNTWQLVCKYYKAYYIVGYLAGLLTETNNVGFVGAEDFPVYKAALNAYYLGAKEANPNVKVYYTFTGSWDDPVTNKGAAEAQIAKGVDFITICVDLGTYGVIEAARAAPRHVWLVSMDMDKYSVDPEHFITSVVIETGKGYEYMLEQIMNGKKGGYYILELGKGIDLAPIRADVPQEIKDKIATLKSDVLSGKVEVQEIMDKIIVPKE